MLESTRTLCESIIILYASSSISILSNLISIPLLVLKLIPNAVVVVFNNKKAFCIPSFFVKKILSGFFNKLSLKLVFKGSGMIGLIISESIFS